MNSNVQATRDRVTRAMGRVRPAIGAADVLSSGLARVPEIEPDGLVRIELNLAPDDDPGLMETLRLVVSGVDGVSRVVIHAVGRGAPERVPDRSAAHDAVPGTVRAAAEANTPAARPRSGDGGGGRRVLPVVGPAPPRPPSPGGPAPQRVRTEEASRHPRDAPPLDGVRSVVAVSSGKGGVGKSTVATNLAAAWAGRGYRVGLLDADIYGPDIPTMFGAHDRPRVEDDRVLPVQAHGVRLMSLGFLVDEDTPAIWRGPIIMGIVRQFLHQVDWGELDYLIVDLPPGTGDAQLSLVQLVRVDGAVMVTTPQDVSVSGVLKGVRMFESVDVDVIGMVENMRGFVCPECQVTHDIFGAGGGEKLSASLGVPFLGSVPLGLAVREEGDRGTPTVVGRPESAEGRALAAIADAVEARVRELTERAAAL